MVELALVHELPDEPQLVLVRLDLVLLQCVQDSLDVGYLVAPGYAPPSPRVKDSAQNSAPARRGREGKMAAAGGVVEGKRLSNTMRQIIHTMRHLTSPQNKFFVLLSRV